jgi:hypothetical protein
MRRSFVGILLLALAAAAPAKLYKWVDADGNVTYSERKPPDRKVEEVKLLGVPSVTNEQARERLEKINEQSETSRKDREFKETYAAESAEREERLKQNCETARQNLRVLENASRVRGDNDSFLTDAQREQRLTQTRQQIEDNCN